LQERPAQLQMLRALNLKLSKLEIEVFVISLLMYWILLRYTRCLAHEYGIGLYKKSFQIVMLKLFVKILVKLS